MGTGLAVTVGVTLTNGVGCTGTGAEEAEGLADGLAVGVVVGSLAVTKLPVGAVVPAAVVPLGVVQAAVVARMLRAPQPMAVTFAPGRAHAMALPTLMEPPDQARHKGSAQRMACFSLEY
jgi:hypothetical protein